RRANGDDDQHQQHEQRERGAKVTGEPAEEATQPRRLGLQTWSREHHIRHCSILGSTAAQSRSAIRLTRITTITMANTTPCTIGKSRWMAPRTIRLPMPGMANTASMTTVAASMRLTSTLTMVKRLTATFFSPCCQRMRFIDSPLACSVRTYCDDSTSNSD